MTKEAIVKQVQGITLIGKSDSNHWLTMDGAPELGGTLAGATPKELVLIGLAGCTSMDVIPMLKKRRANVTGFELKATGIEREEHPRAFTEIHLEYIFYGEGIKPADVERAIDLSMTKYCSVSAMLKPQVKITHSYKIITSQEAAATPASPPQA
ncbi:MAG: OsmC family protein [bacterium]